VVEKDYKTHEKWCGDKSTGPRNDRGSAGNSYKEVISVQTLGFKPSCKCGYLDPMPCTVLDPFLGSGTTGLVAQKMGRRWIGIELNPEYAKMAQKRISQAGILFEDDKENR
jgi:hypothetical protein